jgi:cell wall-associated NlpC family hydrolase
VHLLAAVTALSLAAPAPEAVVQTARRFLGKHYVYGGVGVEGFDCSGFVREVFARHGIKLPRTSRDQAAVGMAVRGDDLRPGDLLFFTAEPGGIAITHVGIATGAQQMIHASTSRRRILIDRIDVRHYKERFLFARRILPNQGTKAAYKPRRRSASDGRR